MATTDQSFYDFYVDTVGGGIANGDLQTQWYSSLGNEAVNSTFGAAANMFGNQASAAVQDAAYWRNIASNWQNVANNAQSSAGAASAAAQTAAATAKYQSAMAQAAGYATQAARAAAAAAAQAGQAANLGATGYQFYQAISQGDYRSLSQNAWGAAYGAWADVKAGQWAARYGWSFATRATVGVGMATAAWFAGQWVGGKIYDAFQDSQWFQDAADTVFDTLFDDDWGDWIPQDVSDWVNDFFKRAQQWVRPRDPLTFDLDGDGIETLGFNANAPILFDHDGDGIKTGTGWVGPDDGFLVLDRNGNGAIDSGLELFGDSTPLAGGGRAEDGFAALAQEDTNNDGKVDGNDARWNDLRIWRDANSDGISQTDELHTLASLNIASINVAKTENSQLLANGNVIADLGTYTKTDGSNGTLGITAGTADVNLAEETFHSQRRAQKMLRLDGPQAASHQCRQRTIQAYSRHVGVSRSVAWNPHHPRIPALISAESVPWGGEGAVSLTRG